MKPLYGEPRAAQGEPGAARADRLPDAPPDLPDLYFPEADMVLFDPEKHLSPLSLVQGANDAFLPLARAARVNPGLVLIPGDEDCKALWERYSMPEHIRDHSARVAEMAEALVRRAVVLGMKVNVEAVRAAGLLHDLGKAWSISRGGNHAQLGAAWVMRETRNAPIARAVLFHVFWPFPEKCDEAHFMIAAVIYADKRTLHDGFVSLEDRHADLLERYGVNEAARGRIQAAHMQGVRIEENLSRRLGLELHDHVPEQGRLVLR
ncbi:MAG: HDIG domain-containing protein [Desulfovibrio sp.]|nr:HDIG domain-containing protein [Desulfovibrio sp.]